MNKTIWKYPLSSVDERFELVMPKHARVLAVQTQNNKPTLWVELDLDKSNEVRTFRVFATGEIHPPDEQLTYLGTAMTDGYFVWHVYEVIP